MRRVRKSGLEEERIVEVHDLGVAEAELDARLSELFGRSPRPSLDPRFARRVLTAVAHERRASLARRLSLALSLYWLVAAVAALSLLLSLDWPGGGFSLSSQLWVVGLGGLAATPLVLLHWALRWGLRRGGLFVLFDTPVASGRR